MAIDRDPCCMSQVELIARLEELCQLYPTARAVRDRFYPNGWTMDALLLLAVCASEDALARSQELIKLHTTGLPPMIIQVTPEEMVHLRAELPYRDGKEADHGHTSSGS